MKPSKNIRPRQTREILRAGRHAWSIERDLNVYVVINFVVPDGDELRAQRQFRAIRAKARSWMYYKRKDFWVDAVTDLRVWENAGGILHVNWPIHVPAALRDEFEEKLPMWIAKVMGSLPDGCYSLTDVYNINSLMRYILKGTQHGHAHRFDIRPVPQGEVYGRRAVASTCLGKAARLRDETSGLAVRKSNKYRKIIVPVETETPAEAGV